MTKPVLLPPGPPPRYKNPDKAARLLKRHRLPKPVGVQEVTLVCDEFSSVCPATGQPDYSTVRIRYMPTDFIIESKALKAYLWSYREHGALCEELARMIAADVMAHIQPEIVYVTVQQKPRGGIGIDAVASFSRADCDPK